VAIAIAAAMIPANGESATLIVIATVLYLVGMVGFEAVTRRGAVRTG
jgi:hypothetical protein